MYKRRGGKREKKKYNPIHEDKIHSTTKTIPTSRLDRIFSLPPAGGLGWDGSERCTTLSLPRRATALLGLLLSSTSYLLLFSFFLFLLFFMVTFFTSSILLSLLLRLAITRS